MVKHIVYSLGVLPCVYGVWFPIYVYIESDDNAYTGSLKQTLKVTASYIQSLKVMWLIPLFASLFAMHYTFNISTVE